MTAPTASLPAAAPAPTSSSSSGGLDLVKAPLDQVIQSLNTSTVQGLSEAEAQSRLTKDGPNAVVMKHES